VTPIQEQKDDTPGLLVRLHCALFRWLSSGGERGAASRAVRRSHLLIDGRVLS